MNARELADKYKKQGYIDISGDGKNEKELSAFNLIVEALKFYANVKPHLKEIEYLDLFFIENNCPVCRKINPAQKNLDREYEKIDKTATHFPDDAYGHAPDCWIGNNV